MDLMARCQKCGGDKQGNQWICPACAYQPTQAELQQADWIFEELRRELAEKEAQFREGAGLSLEHTLWRISDVAGWWEGRERARKRLEEVADG